MRALAGGAMVLLMLLPGEAMHPSCLSPSGRSARLETDASAETQSAVSEHAGKDAAAIFREGKTALQTGQLAAAEDDFRQVIVLDPKSGPAHINLGVAYMRDKHWDEALEEFRQAQKLSPQEAGVLLNIGLVYYRKGEFSTAIEPLTKAVERMPDSTQARYLLGLCSFFVNQYGQASETLAPLWDKESTNLNYLYVVSIAASKSGNPTLQDRSYNQMLSVGRDTPEFHMYLGKARLAEGDTGRALDEFRAALACRPDLPLVHYFLGRTYLERHTYPDAIGELELQVAADPSFAYSYEDLGILSAQQDEPTKAEHYFLEAIQRNKNLVNSYFGLAKVYRESGRAPEALDMLNHAVDIVPQSASLHFTKGQVLKQLGRSSEARREFDLAAALHKSFNDRLQQDHSADTAADAEAAAQE